MNRSTTFSLSESKQAKTTIPYMKTIYLFLFTLILTSTVLSQAPNYTFAHGLGSLNQDQAAAVTTDGSANTIVTGNFSDTIDFDLSVSVNTLVAKGFGDIFIAKYNSAGVHQWAFAMGGSGGYDSGQGL